MNLMMLPPWAGAVLIPAPLPWPVVLDAPCEIYTDVEGIYGVDPPALSPGPQTGCRIL